MGVRCAAWPCFNGLVAATSRTGESSQSLTPKRQAEADADRDQSTEEASGSTRENASAQPGNDWPSVVFLSLAYACNFSSLTGAVATVGLASKDIAPDSSVQTLPVACIFYFMGIANIFLPFELRRWGRAMAYVFGAILGITGCSLMAASLAWESFGLLCLGSCLLGLSVGHAMSYRFAATSLAPKRTSRAIASVLAGGVLGAALGPGALARARRLLPVDFAGIYVLGAGMNVVALILLFFVKFSAAVRPQEQQGAAAEKRPILRVLAQPKCWVAIVGGTGAYSIMMFLMASIPVVIREIFDHTYDEATLVIALHMVLMFAPSLVTGSCVDKLGAAPVMLFGCGLYWVALGILIGGGSLPHFFVGMAVLGIAFNVLYVSSTIQLTRSYNPAEGANVQAVNDGIIWPMAATAAIVSFPLITNIGWKEALIVEMALTAVTAMAVAFLFVHELGARSRAQRQDSGSKAAVQDDAAGAADQNDAADAA